MKNKMYKMLALMATLTLLATVLMVKIPVVMANTTIYVPEDHLTIQYAVNNASSGDTIIVHDGTYPESVIVGTDNITIRSDTLHGAVVDPPGAGNCFTVTADNVTIDGFELSGTSSGYGIGFSGSHNVFSNNKIHNINCGGTGGGICCWDTGTAGPSNYNNISNNEIYDVTADGILTGCCRMNAVMDGNIITGNTIYNFATEDGWNPAIEEVNGKNYVISNNNITGSTQYYGILHTSWNGIPQSGNTISGNTITGLTTYGAAICMMADTGEGSGCGGVIHGFTAPAEVVAKDSVIEDNNIHGNKHGIMLYAYGGITTNATISGIEILNNNVHDNLQNGIYFVTLFGNDTIKDNVVQGNDLTGNNVGARVRAVTAGATFTNNTFHYNNIFGNGVGINNTAGETIDARYNWWGSPFGPTASPPAGDKISGYVDYAPWLIEEYPPAVLVPKLYVDPETKEVWTPAECTEFNVTIVIEGVTDLYGFEFKLTWNSSLINLVKIHVKVNQIWTSCFIAHNETWHEPDCTDWYWLAASATAPMTKGFDGTAILVELTFHIKYDPCYPDACSTPIHFVDVKLSDSNADPIPIWVQDGLYQIWSSKPKLEIKPAITEVSKYQDFSVEIWLLNATKVYSYAFKVCYNTTILDVANVVIHNEFLPGPYLIKSLQINETEGSVSVEIQEADSAPPANGDGLLVTITFRVTEVAIWKKCYTNTLYSLMELKSWKLDVKCPIPRIQEGDLVGISNADYWFRPVPGDVNSDGVVNVVDLRMVAMKWCNTDPETLNQLDLNCDSHVDIYDLVLVAKNLTH